MGVDEHFMELSESEVGERADDDSHERAFRAARPELLHDDFRKDQARSRKAKQVSDSLPDL